MYKKSKKKNRYCKNLQYLFGPIINVKDVNQLPTVNKTVDEDDYPDTRILDTYSLEFLDLPNEFSEKDLKNAIIKDLKDFILEVGKDFTFIGDEYRVQVGNHDFFIDLLFYNRELTSVSVANILIVPVSCTTILSE